MLINEEKILKYYVDLQDKNKNKIINYKNNIYDKYLDVKKIDQDINELKIKKTLELINNNTFEANEIDNQLKHKLVEQNNLYNKYNIKFDENIINYNCLKCKDTGFVDGVKCDCFLEKEIEQLKQNSKIPVAYTNWSFDNMNIDLFKQKINITDTKNYYDYIIDNINNIKNKINNILNESFFIFISGGTGTGKTYFSISIANELLNKHHSVLYLSTDEFINMYFDNNNEANDYFKEYKMLILDDLGKENISQFSISKIFNLINNRFKNSLSLIINTVFDFKDIGDIYGSSIVSRLFNDFYVIKLYGKDLRGLV